MKSAKGVLKFSTAALLVLAWISVSSRVARGAEPEQGAASPANDDSSFPDLNAVLQGKVFRSKFERDVFFLRRIRENYSAHWPALLDANISVKDYVVAPDKLLLFIEELGAAMVDTDDVTASVRLATVTSDPVFYANTDAYHPEILRAAASALIRIGPRGRLALAASFSEAHNKGEHYAKWTPELSPTVSRPGGRRSGAPSPARLPATRIGSKLRFIPQAYKPTGRPTVRRINYR